MKYINKMLLLLVVIANVSGQVACYTYNFVNRTRKTLRVKAYGEAVFGKPNYLGSGQFVTIAPGQEAKITGTGGLAGVCLGEIKVALPNEGFRDAVISMQDEGSKTQIVSLIGKLADALDAFNLDFSQESVDELAQQAETGAETTVQTASGGLTGAQIYNTVQEAVKFGAKVAAVGAALQQAGQCTSRTYEILYIPGVEREVKVGTKTYTAKDVLPFALYVP